MPTDTEEHHQDHTRQPHRRTRHVLRTFLGSPSCTRRTAAQRTFLTHAGNWGFGTAPLGQARTSPGDRPSLGGKTPGVRGSAHPRTPGSRSRPGGRPAYVVLTA